MSHIDDVPADDVMVMTNDLQDKESVKTTDVIKYNMINMKYKILFRRK